MMNRLIKSEQGSAMVLAVMVTTIVITLITLVVTVAMSATTQSLATARVVSADTVAETGSDYFTKYVEDVVADAPDLTSVDTDRINGMTVELDASGNQIFEISDIQIVTSSGDTPMLSVHYTVKSHVKGRELNQEDAPVTTSKLQDVIEITE